MTAATLGFVFVIIGLAGVIVLTAIKAWKYAHLPVHSRVELYPVPKEGDGRGKYGGSYFEEEDWWEKPRRLDPVYEVVDIMAEMLLISKLFKHQRSLWWASYAFHLGIYVMFGWSLLLLLTVFWNPEFLEEGKDPRKSWTTCNMNVLTKNTGYYNPEFGTYTLRGINVKIEKAARPDGIWYEPADFAPWLPQPTENTGGGAA